MMRTQQRGGAGFTVNLFSITACHGSRVLRHAQVAEDEARPETEFAHQLGDGWGWLRAMRRFLE